MKELIHIACNDPQAVEGLKSVIAAGGYTCRLFSGGTDLLGGIKDQTPDLVILDLLLPDTTGVEVLEEIRRSVPSLPVIMISEKVLVTTAVTAMQLGATDFLESPRDPGRVLVAIKHALKTTDLERRLEDLKDELQDRYEMVGQSDGMQRVRSQVRRAARTTASVLITGESGVGKELVARALHLQSPRATRPFVPLNCAAIPVTLIESELFGCEKGAYTGAGATRMGKLEDANTGTIFLDEIGDMDLSTQAKLLRFLNDSEIQRLGGNKFIHVDARVITATNKDLQALIRSHDFREDLYYRLNVVVIDVPPLRERAVDIELLAIHFLKHYCSTYNRMLSLAPQSLEVLKDYSWPGNVRELQNIIERLVAMAETDPVDPEEIRSYLDPGARTVTRGTLKVVVDQAEREAVERALAQANGNVAEAAVALGILVPSLYRLMRRFTIATPTQIQNRDLPPT